MASKSISELQAASTIAGIELLEIAQLSPTVTITATTISASAADNSFNDSADGFVAAGFAVGDRVRVVGFTGDVANNITSGRVTDVVAGKLTIGGADGDVLVDEAAGESVTITKWVSRRVSIADLAAAAGKQCIVIAVGDETTALTAGVNKVRFRMPYAMTLTEVKSSCNTPPTGATLIADINEGGASILSTKLSIDAGETTSATAAVPAVISDAALAADAEIAIDIDQVGSTVAGTGLKIYLIGVPA